METASFWFMVVLINILDETSREAGWSGLMAAHGWALIGMAFTMIVVRAFSTSRIGIPPRGPLGSVWAAGLTVSLAPTTSATSHSLKALLMSSSS